MYITLQTQNIRYVDLFLPPTVYSELFLETANDGRLISKYTDALCTMPLSCFGAFLCLEKGHGLVKPRRLDRDRTRTCNPQIRSLMPSPLGHTATGFGYVCTICNYADISDKETLASLAGANS